jgi:hypothetical protein
LDSDEQAPLPPARILEAHEIRAVLNEPVYIGNFKRKRGSGPLAKVGPDSHSYIEGMGFIHARGVYSARFGSGAPAWLAELHPSHARKLCKLSIAQNATLPEVYPVCLLT